MERAPLYDDVADGPDKGVAYWLKTADGVRIRVGHWNRPAAKGTILIFPGRTEFIEKYGRSAKAFHERGYACLAVDWRGQGIADRMIPNRAIGHVGEFSDYQHDVAAVVAHAKTLGLPQPFFMIGHSMGGCIGLRALIDGIDVKAAMFSAPMWGIQMSPALRPVAWGLSTVSKSLGFDQNLAPYQFEETYVLRTDFETNTLTCDRDTFDHLRRQLTTHPELALGGPSLRWINTSLREMHRLSVTPAPDLPCITFLGSDEEIVDPVRIRNRMQDWHGGTLREIPQGRHEMLMDKPAMRDPILDETTALFDAQCAQTELSA